MEQINENQIRCFLSREEMESRHLHLKELAYGTDQARRLFHELMQEARVRFGFEAQNMPVMIEAVPMADNSLILLITRVDNPEELDTRYSSFAPSVRNGSDDADLPASSTLSQLLDTIRRQIENRKPPLETAEDGKEEAVSGSKKSGRTGQKPAKDRAAAGLPGSVPGRGRKMPAGAGKEGGTASPQAQLYTFRSLGRAADAAGAAVSSYRGASALYRDPADARYYLFLSPETEGDVADLTGALSVFSEFGASEYITPAREQYLLEHCEVLCADGAVQKLAALGAAPGPA